MTRASSSRWFAFVVGAVCALAAGCAGPAARAPGGGTIAAGAIDFGSRLYVGMAPDEVREVLGNPARIVAAPESGGVSETWIYIKDQKQSVRQVASRTQDVPYIDPITGELRMLAEPAYSLELTTTTEELHLFWQDGELAGWRPHAYSTRRYGE